MVRTPLALYEPRLEDLRVLVVGLGKSGLAAVRLAASRGARVIVTDARSKEELGSAVGEVEALGAEVMAGGTPAALADGVDLLILSPGVPMDLPLLVEARDRDVTIWGEVELAWRFCRGRILGITGSNGKSTVTSMAGTILRTAGIPGGTGGNLGPPLTDLLESDGPEAVHAVELSSFQLESIQAFRPQGAVVVNLSPDHLDRYPSFESYVQAKSRILAAQDPGGFAILNADDPESARLKEAVRGRLYHFSTRTKLEKGAWLEDGILTLATEAGAGAPLVGAELSVPGEHNQANALAAALACALLGCGREAIVDGLRSFRALPHRLQHVATIGGVDFYDDSKATNLAAASRALQSFPPGRVHLILGGRDKGADWGSLAPLIRRFARRVLLVGEAVPAIRSGLAETVPLVECRTVPEAVDRGLKGARGGDVVLLAPGCASFDQYRSFEERGEDFRRAVESMSTDGGRLA